MGLLVTRVPPMTDSRHGEYDDPAVPTRRQPARALVIAALAPLVITYAAVAVIFALVSVAAAHATFSAGDTLLAAGPGMLAVYQVPVEIGGAALGALPLLPTIGAVFLIRRTASGAARRLGYSEPGQAFVVVGVIAGAHAAAGGLMSAAVNASSPSVTPLTALLLPGLLAAVAALLGAGPHCGIMPMLRRKLNPVAMSGLRAGMLGSAVLLSTGTAVFALATVFSSATVRQLFAASAPGTGGALGMLLLSAGYAPNAVMAATSMLLGSGFSLGELSASPFGFTPGAVPGIPLLASLPESYADWWPLLLACPLACGVFVGFTVRHAAVRVTVRLRMVLIAGVVVAIGMLLLATLASGQLGVGRLSPVEVPVGLLSVAGFGWIVVPAGVVAWLAGPHRPLGSGWREGIVAGSMPDPDEPGEFVDPEEPDAPGESYDPDEPEGPGEPGELDEPEELDDPEAPDDPGDPDDSLAADGTAEPEARTTQ